MFATITETRGIGIERLLLGSSPNFDTLTRPLSGLQVSLARQASRQACGSVLMLELGRLTQGSGARPYLRGEATLAFEWSWRFETDSGVLFGSSSETAFVYLQLNELQGQRVTGIRLDGQFSELVLELSGGLRARSLACVEGDPGWWLWLPDKSSLHCEKGALRHERSQAR
jgi:hypothetical protein